MTFFERLGEIVGIAMIVGFIWFGASAIQRAVSDLPPACVSVGGGCQ
ncbi:hypothetical protein ACQR2B_06825 [Bradyrhizobium oligotrophicum]